MIFNPVVTQAQTLELVNGNVTDVTVCYTQDGINYVTENVDYTGKNIVALNGSAIYCVSNNLRGMVSATNVNSIYGENTNNYFGQINGDNFSIISTT